MKGQSAPLHIQAAQLKKSLENREKRRNADRNHRSEEAQQQGTADVYDDADRQRKRMHGAGAAASNSAVAALAAISDASAHYQQPVLLVCELCKATFTNSVQQQQHLEGPVHRKAVEKQAAEAARRQRMSAYNDVAEAALGAAAWNTTHGGGRGRGEGGGGGGGAQGRRPGPRPGALDADAAGPGPSSKQQRQQQQRKGQAHAEQGAAAAGGASGSRQAVPSHEELVAQARADDDGPLSIGGWVPPSVSLATTSTAQQQQATGAAAAAAAVAKAAPGGAGEPSKGGAGKQEDSEDDAGEKGGLLGLAYGDDQDGDGESSDSSSEDSGEGPAGGVPVSFF